MVIERGGAPADGTRRGWLSAFYDWLTKPSAHHHSSAMDLVDGEIRPVRIAHYVIARKLGQGGMGVVYAARDERLERRVALKMMSSEVYEQTARQRFWREARAAARVNHPNVCQIYEIGEDNGGLFIAMELLEGEPLDKRLQRGALSVSQAVPIGLDMLAALSAVHAGGIIHRDLKPSNVFLTTHGVKLLDFGLATPEPRESSSGDAKLTRTGIVIGTPNYMAPERVIGDVVDARSDLFAVGAILFEMLSGRPAFGGRSVAEVVHCAVHEQPPALSGAPAVNAVDRVIRRALAKRPSDRQASADEMAEDLRTVGIVDRDDRAAVARTLTRIVVLPFRVLRPEPESDFLAFSLPDAIANSLSGRGSLVVRSSAVAARFGSEPTDLRSLAAEVDVDRVVTGTLLRAGDYVRATVQLLEAPSGTVLTSLTTQSPLDDLFRLQDDVARRVVESLPLPLGGTESPKPDIPHDRGAYELYLRANELARTYEGMTRALDLYARCLELDPDFAPGWAHFGRCRRRVGKFIDGTADSESQAEQAFRRALELNPRLTVAHKFYAHLQAEIGQAPRALVRLLHEAHSHGTDPELFAGLVHACRYCGLYEQSLAAPAEARRLDPTVPTSIDETLVMVGAIEQLLALDRPLLVSGAEDGNRVIGLGLAGRRDEARRALADMRRASYSPIVGAWTEYLAAWLDRRSAASGSS